MKKADIFSQEIEILFENGKSKLQTHCGVVFGAIMVLLIIAQGVFKAGIMLNYEDNTIQEPIQENYFAIDYEYGTQDGWHIAFGVTAYDSSSDQTPFDDTIGSVAAFLKIWGEKDEDGNSKPTYFKPLETRPCEDSDINFEGNGDNDDNYRFSHPSPEFLYDVKRFKSSLNCFVDEPVVMGDYNAAAAKQLVIRFDRCRGDGCKSEEFIDSWLNRKFLLVLENQYEFNKELVEEEKVSKSSRLVWNVLSPQIRVDIYNYVHILKLDLSDKIGSIGTD